MNLYKLKLDEVINIASTIAKIIDEEYKRKKLYEKFKKSQRKSHKNKEEIKK